MNPGAASAWLARALPLSRPRQWPILTAQLLVGVLLAQPAGVAPRALLVPEALAVLAGAWLAWVVLLNGGTLAYNSAWDRDTGPVAYLPTPPLPPRGLAHAALGVMVLGVAVGAVVVGTAFAAVTTVCVLLSVLYSHPGYRWKSVPGLDLAVNMVGYGAGTTLAGVLAGRAATGAAASAATPWLAAGFGLLFGSLYPLTQIYQVEDDRARGDRTLTTAAGVRPALALALVLGMLAGILLAVATALGTDSGAALLPLLGVGLWVLHLAWWWRRAPGMAPAAHEAGMYRALLLWAGVDLTLVAAWYL